MRVINSRLQKLGHYFRVTRKRLRHSTGSDNDK